MIVRLLAAASAVALAAPAFAAETVFNTDLPAVNGNFGAGVATTTTGPTGTTTNVAGPGGGANRASAAYQTGEWVQRNVGGNATVGITTNYARSGNGSAFFQGTDGNSKADLELVFESATSLSNVRSLSYDWYRDAASTNNPIQVNSLRLMVASGQATTYLIFEPYYNGQANPAPTGSWQSSTITGDSIVWSNNTLLNLPANTNSCNVGCFAKLSDWQAANPNALVYGLSSGIGSGWSGAYQGAIDNVSYDFGSFGSNSYNFEVNAVPEPATWAMMIGGFAFVGAAARRRSSKVVTA
jgi:hypothetical protein